MPDPIKLPPLPMLPNPAWSGHEVAFQCHEYAIAYARLAIKAHMDGLAKRGTPVGTPPYQTLPWVADLLNRKGMLGSTLIGLIDAIEQAVRQECEAEIERLQAKVDAIETCCCGEPMDRHSSPMDCGHTPVSMYDYAYSSMKERVEAHARDAARYRWLRMNCIKTVPECRDGPDYKELQFHGPIQKDWRFALDQMSLDAAIDAAMAEQGEKA